MLKLDSRKSALSLFITLNTTQLVYLSQLPISSIIFPEELAQKIVNTAKYPLFCREVVNSRALEANPEV